MDNPTYHFEYYRFDNILWSSVSYQGESYRANSASINWISDSGAIVSLDDSEMFQLKGGFWQEL